MKFFILLIAIAAATNLRNSDFRSFALKYGKNYLDNEIEYRQRVFELNMKWADKVNAEGHRFTVGATEYADMTNTEFAASKLCGCMLRSTSSKPAVPARNIRIPDEIDWKEKGAVGETKNQGSCGSCWAFSATGSLEGGYWIQSGKLVSLSEQQLVDCDPKSHGCSGGLMTYAFEYVMKKGLCLGDDYPYHAKDEDCKDDTCKAEIHITSYEEVEEMSGVALKEALAERPVSVAVAGSSSVFQMYTGGVIDSEKCGTSLNHGILSLGYKDDYIMVRNSWGPSWGEKGFGKILYVPKGAGICGLNQMNSYPIF